MNYFRFGVAAVCSLQLATYPIAAGAADVVRTLPEGARVYLVLNELVSGKRGEADVGQKVRCSVWRDVIHEGTVFIKARAPALCKVDKVGHANIAGVKGKLSIGALETEAIDGQTVQLEGGYMKEGKSRMALSISLGVVLFLPLIFIPGKAAELPDGTVFDAFTGPSMKVRVAATSPEARMVDLSTMMGGFAADVDYEYLQSQEKPKVFRINASSEGKTPGKLVIDSVNEVRLGAPLAMQTISSDRNGENWSIVAEIDIKTLAKHFAKGINRFDVAYMDDGQRIATEVVLNIQM